MPTEQDLPAAHVAQHVGDRLLICVVQQARLYCVGHEIDMASVHVVVSRDDQDVFTRESRLDRG